MEGPENILKRTAFCFYIDLQMSWSALEKSGNGVATVLQRCCNGVAALEPLFGSMY